MPDSDLKYLPPQNLDAEQMILGAILLEPGYVLPEVKVRAEDFYKTAHGVIFTAMRTLWDRQEAIDLVTVSDALRASKAIESVGGASYLATLVSLVPTAANFRTHEKIIIRMSQLRAAISIFHDVIARAYRLEDPDEIITSCIQRLNDVRRHEGAALVSQREMIQAGFADVERRYERAMSGKIIGVPTGLRDLDRVTGGLQPGYYVIAARPSMGKTALAEQIRDAGAIYFLREWMNTPEKDRPLKPLHTVGFVSIEMGKDALALRSLSRQAEIPLSRILAGTLLERDWIPLSNAAGKLCELPIHYEFEAASDVRVGRKIDELAQKHGAKLIIIDYTQLMKSEEKHGSREQEISSISRMIRYKINQHHIPIIALAQLNRELEKRPDKKPMLADLRESGSIEQDADCVIFIYREEVYNPCKCSPEGECYCGRRGKAQLLGRKGRMIGTWDIDLLWHGNTTSFKDA